MDTKTLEQEILTEVQKLNIKEQLQVLQYVQLIAKSDHVIGEPGWKMVQHARELNFPKDDLEEMAQAIEEWCERVDNFPEIDLDALVQAGIKREDIILAYAGEVVPEVMG